MKSNIFLNMCEKNMEYKNFCRLKQNKNLILIIKNAHTLKANGRADTIKSELPSDASSNSLKGHGFCALLIVEDKIDAVIVQENCIYEIVYQ